MSKQQLESSLEFLQELWQDHKDMQDTINTEHPSYKEGSEEHSCFRNHEITMMRIEIIKKQLLIMKQNPLLMGQRVQMPEG